MSLCQILDLLAVGCGATWAMGSCRHFGHTPRQPANARAVGLRNLSGDCKKPSRNAWATLYIEGMSRDSRDQARIPGA